MQVTQDKSKIKIHCNRFRQAIQKIPASGRPIDFRNFPSGSCGSTSELIGTYLEGLGFGKFYYVHGSKPGIESHAWIKQGRLIVDLTADQFHEINIPVMVLDESPWHNEFEISACHAIDLVATDKTAFLPLLPFYEKILRVIQESNHEP
ncbi:MAG: hypothetical protein ACN6PH_10680 [Pseudomonas sp.]